MKIEITCKECNKRWMEWESNKRKFWSRKCFNSDWVSNISIANKIRGLGVKIYKCKHCTKEFKNQRSNHRIYCSRKCSNQYTLITREKVLGAKNPLWNGGSSLRQIRPKWWRLAVFNKDNYTCQMCFTRGSDLQADHIRPWWAFPELRFDITNGQALCKTCHSKKTGMDLWFRRKIAKLVKEERMIKLGYTI
jgi:endogenous inhibitor of DNA gyrase (YacG/DUF329 family)